MSAAEDEFEWVGESIRLRPRPEMSGYLEQRDGEQYLVAQEAMNPVGWIACTTMVEVER